MSYITISNPSSVTGRAVAALNSAAGYVARLHANRRLAITLSRMGPEALADIGLSRQDVSDLSALSPSSDAGLFLSSRVAERRRTR